jgi:anaerobic selenocysteine-containing dehydrogenase
MAREIKHTICFRCKPRCRLELEVEDNQIVNVSTSPIKKKAKTSGSRSPGTKPWMRSPPNYKHSRINTALRRWGLRPVPAAHMKNSTHAF